VAGFEEVLTGVEGTAPPAVVVGGAGVTAGVAVVAAAAVEPAVAGTGELAAPVPPLPVTLPVVDELPDLELWLVEGLESTNRSNHFLA
jgi:hypothetical protein